MLPSLLRREAIADVRDQFVIAPHHPDRLRRPRASLGDVERHRSEQALTWNVFRTLEMVAPAFWLRRLQARLDAEPLTAAPQVVRISLWQPLALPPIQRLDGGRDDVLADVVIETEHALWTLIVAGSSDRWNEDGDRVAQVIDAGAWLAGARRHYCGVIEAEMSHTSVGRLLQQRYSRSAGSVGLRSATRGPAAPSLKGVGVVEWAGLAAILGECESSQSLPAIERALARNALLWLRSALPRGR